MASLTTHYQLQKLAQGDPFITNGQKFTTADRDLIDRLLYIGAQGHHHNGAAAGNSNPTLPAQLTVDTTQGHLPAGTRAYYQYTYVDPTGAETAASPTSFVDLPGQIATPAAPAASFVSGGGTLPAGGYFYELSAYSGTSNTSETPASVPAYIATNGVGAIVLTLPTLPAGATGFNVYRRGPGGASYLYLTSVTSGGTFTDNGSLAEDCNRLAPTVNTTKSTNAVNFTLPAAPPSGWTWNLYRSTTSGSWANSLLANVTQLDTNGHLLLTYLDLGLATGIGSPPASAQQIGSPSKIDLASESTGTLPPGRVDAFLVTVEFAFPGLITTIQGQSVWVCDFPAAEIVSVRACLGRGAYADTSAVTVDVLRRAAAAPTPTYASIFAAEATPTYPTVSPGAQIGVLVTPGTTLAINDSLVVDVLSTGGTDGNNVQHSRDLTVAVTMLVSGSALPATNPF